MLHAESPASRKKPTGRRGLCVTDVHPDGSEGVVVMLLPGGIAPPMTDRLAALRTSTDHLHTLVTGLDPDALRRPAYPTGWTVADVLSHLGSSAEIFRAGFDAALAGGTDDPDREAIWAAWTRSRRTARPRTHSSRTRH